MGLSQRAVIFFALTGTCFLFIGLRLYVRIRILHKFEAADLLVCVAWCTLLFQALIQIWAAGWGFTNPKIQWFNSPHLPDFENIIPNKDDIRKGLILTYVRLPLSNICLYCVKISFLLLYRQIFPPAFRKLRIALNVVFVFVIMAFISNLGIDLLYCLPPGRNWTSNPADRCLNIASLTRYYYVAMMHIATDLVVYSLPFFLLPTLYRSRQTSRQKLAGIIGMMSLGFTCILCLVIRVVLTAPGGSAYLIAVLGSLEQFIAVIVACCPPLRFLWSRRSPPGSEAEAEAEKAGGGGRGGEGGNEEQRVQTRTTWRFWRMGVHNGGPGSTMETYAVPSEKDMTTTVATDATGAGLFISDESIHAASGGGLAPMPRRYNKAAPSCSVAAEGSVSEASGAEGKAEPTDTKGSGRQDGQRKGFWGKMKTKPTNRKDSQTKTSSKRGPGRTFGGTDYTTHHGEDEPGVPDPMPSTPPLSSKEAKGRPTSLSPPRVADDVSLNTLGASPR